jgi:hypothetical protein
VWLGQAQVTPTGVESELIQLGAVGVVAALALLAVRVLFARVTATADLERARADRLEEELRKLNADIQERYLTTLSEATRAISAALAEQHRDVKR